MGCRDQLEALLMRSPPALTTEPPTIDGAVGNATRDPEPSIPAALPPQGARAEGSVASAETSALSDLAGEAADAESIRFSRMQQLLALIGCGTQRGLWAHRCSDTRVG